VAIDHVILPVRDYASGKRFYEATLGALGYTLLLDWPDRRRAWFGVVGSPSSLWLAESDAAGSLEVCLAADCPEAVEGFHSDALDVGASSTWEPGVRAEFSRDYYAARVHDPDGNSIEVVFRGQIAASSIAA
jgi:catechol 2,3-dioxygenase-like lactoylglutathione lyase family enzyme